MMPSLLSCNSTPNLPATFGRTRWARSTTSCRAKEASRVILSCQPCSPLPSMKSFKQSPRGLLPSENFFAFWDDIFIDATRERPAILHRQVETALQDHARTRTNQGKTQIRNRAGVFPVGCGHIVEAGRRASPPVVVLRGDQSLPTSEQGTRV